MENKLYIGLDLGANGGVVILTSDGTVKEVFKNPNTVSDWIEKLEKYKTEHCFCITERVHSMPKNGGKANFTFGFTCGVALSLLEVNQIPFQEVTPQTWIKTYMMKKEKTETSTQWKNRLKNKAKQLFPKENITLWNADAFLIAEFCRRHFK